MKMKLFLPNKLKDYFRFFQVPARKWWLGIIGLVATIVLYIGYQFLITVVLTRNVVDLTSTAEYKEVLRHLMNNLMLGGLVGVSVLVSWIFFRQGFGWLSSVVGRFRWRWFAITITISFIAFFLLNISTTWIFKTPEQLEWLSVRPYTGVVILVVLFTTPLQAAGEEFLFRGLLGRLTATFVHFRRIGLALSVLLPAIIFMIMHADEHLINNLFYLTLAITTWWITYRTGGMEAGIALHIGGNVCSQVVALPFMDLSSPVGRTDDSMSMIITIAVQILLTFLLDLLASRRGLVRMSSPAAAVPQVIKASQIGADFLSSSKTATKEDLPRFDSTPREEV